MTPHCDWGGYAAGIDLCIAGGRLFGWPNRYYN